MGLYSACVEQLDDLSRNPQWRTAIWICRIGGLASIVTVLWALLPPAHAEGPLFLVGASMWLFTGVLTVLTIQRARQEIGIDRPWFWRIRWRFLRDLFRPTPRH